MNVMVTGGLGFIGHNVVKFLEQENHHVSIIDNKTNYGFISKEELDYLISERRKKIKTGVFGIDIRQTDAVDYAFRTTKPEVVIHCASFPRQKIVSINPSLGSEVMCTGLINLLEAAVKHGVRRFLYVSSSMVYGDFDNDVAEYAPCKPIGQYGIMKYMGEKLVEDYHRRTGLEFVIIRPSAVYGELDVEDRVVSKFMMAAMRGETLTVKGSNEILDFTYVEDAAMGITLAALHEKSKNNIYNITRSDRKLYTLKDAAELAISIAGKGSYEIQDKDASFPSRGRLCIDKAVHDFSYMPQVSVEEGFRRYHTWFRHSAYWSEKLK